ncbi:head GIN domain-containing protein [Cupriavidus necator]|uniref:head GIN domain-containing protein n=1 Tax=Cupriavidus necator TaxID=106590 RepID=UPI000A90A504|nr:head GIN domain-containing protein [Cupriavidus necator]
MKQLVKLWVSMFAAVSGIAQGDGTVIVNGSNVVVTGESVAIINGKVYGGADMVKAKGSVVSERRSLPAFHGIDMMLSAEATYRFAPDPGITISAQSDIMSKIKTTVDGGNLVIASDGSFSSDKPIRLLVEGPELSRAVVSGSGRLVANGLHVNAVLLQVSGSGSIVADGTASEVKAMVSGSGSVELANLRAKSLSADVSGAGLVSAYASESAEVGLSGAGNVRVSGNPPRRSVDRSGAGSVRFE